MLKFEVEENVLSNSVLEQEESYPGECQFKNKEKHRVLTFSEAKFMTDEELKETLYIVDEELKNRSDKREQMRENLQEAAIQLCKACKDNGFKLRLDLSDKYMYEIVKNKSVYAYVNELFVVDAKEEK